MSVKMASKKRKNEETSSPEKPAKKTKFQKENQSPKQKAKFDKPKAKNFDKPKAKKFEKDTKNGKKFQKSDDSKQKFNKKDPKKKVFEAKDGKKKVFEAKDGKKKDGAKDGEKEKKEVFIAKDKKEAREHYKKTKAERQKKEMQDGIFELGVESKKLWNELRDRAKSSNNEMTEEKRFKLAAELHEKLKGKIKALIFAHDTVRVVECLMAQGPPDVREALFEEMKDQIIPMAKSKYAHFFVIKMMKYGTKEQKSLVYEVFKGKVAQLMKHKIANNIVEEFYNEWATPAQRNEMIQEFCGPEFRHFKEPGIKTVPDLIAKHPDKKTNIVRHIGDYVTTLINKGCYNHSLVHAVIYNYMLVEEDDKKMAELIESLRDACVHVLHSIEGARLTMMALWKGTNKDRKEIVKSFKTFVGKICAEKEGYLVMLALFDTVDDTKFVGKAILTELAANIEEIAANDRGKKVLEYLLTPRNPTFFSPDIVNLLKKGDGNAVSKKDSSVRSAELKSVIAPAVAQYINANLETIIQNKGKDLIFLQCILKFCPGVEAAMTLLAEEACKPFEQNEPDNFVENTACHMTMRKIIAYDKERTDEVAFSKILLAAIDDDSAECWVRSNRGCFLFVNMIETGIPEVVEGTKKVVQKLSKTLKSQKTKGAEVLREKMK